MRFRSVDRLAVALALVALGALGCDDILGGQVSPLGSDGEGTGDGVVTTADLAGVQAFGTVVRDANGNVSARLDVLSLSGEPHFVSGIANPTLSFGSTTVPLVTGASVGVFETNNTRAPALTYTPGGTYLFAFSAIDQNGDEYVYRSTATAAATEPNVELIDTLIRFAGEPVEVGLQSMSDGGILRVIGPAGITYDTSAIGSLQELAQVRSRMQAVVGPFETVPGTAFPAPGSYTLQVTSLDLADAAPTAADETELGALSWFGGGVIVEVPLQVE